MTDTTRDPAAQNPKTSDARDFVTPRLIAGVVLAILALVFVFQNRGNGRVTFLFWEVNAPAWTWLVLIFAAGVLVGLLVPWFRRRQK